MLHGRHIVLLERRHRDEFAGLIQRMGGVPIVAPALDEVISLDDYQTFVDGLAGGRFSIAVLLSGAGLTALLREADRRGQLRPALDALRASVLVSRGAKPLQALAPYRLKAKVTTASPHTTGELLRALATLAVTDRGVVLVHSGERNAQVADSLRARGARLTEVFPYERAPAGDSGPVTQVVSAVIVRRVDAILFTNRAQCRHLFEVAAGMRQLHSFTASLTQDVVVGAVGPVCARALERAGVTPDVVPPAANMPALLQAVARYFESELAGQGSRGAL